jgi:hypothetical protein
MMSDELAAQIRDGLGAVVDPLGPLLGLDLADVLRDRVSSRAAGLAEQLVSRDHHVISETVIKLMNALWPIGDPPANWWRTPLGRAVAGSIRPEDIEAVAPSVAAAMLGVSRGRVYQLLEQGKLDRHPHGGVVRASVLQRLAGRSQELP